MANENTRNEAFASGPDSFSDGFALDTAVASEGHVEVIHGVYAHRLPLSGMTVGQARSELADRMNIDPDSIAVVDGNEVGDDAILGEGQILNFVTHAGEKGGDRLIIENGQAVLTTEEGTEVKMSEEEFVEMMRSEYEPPIHGDAIPDGVKFIEWRPPFMCVVHQLPAHVRSLRWIEDDSPEPFGPGAKFKKRRLSLPYAVTFAMYFRRARDLSLVGYNELYFRNEPLKTRQDQLGFPSLLNLSRIDIKGRSRSWICTQYLKSPPRASWSAQLASLIDHTWNGSFNLSSEHHEGASWYGESKGVHKSLHPIAAWEQASKENDAFALGVAWKPAKHNVGQLIDAMFAECSGEVGTLRIAARMKRKPAAGGVVARLLRSVQQAKATA